jgi:hypothetical protein
MPNKKINFDLVRQIALALPDVEESTTYGAPSVKVRGKLLTEYRRNLKNQRSVKDSGRWIS